MCVCIYVNLRLELASLEPSRVFLAQNEQSQALLEPGLGSVSARLEPSRGLKVRMYVCVDVCVLLFASVCACV